MPVMLASWRKSPASPRIGQPVVARAIRDQPDHIGITFNVFMNTWWDADGELHIDPPTSVAGTRFTVEAELDLIVGITACSAEKSNGGRCKPIDYEVVE